MPPHPNDDAWARVPLFGALGYALLLATVLPQADGHRVAVAGWLLLPTVIAIGVVVVAATSSRRRWGTRAYALAAPAAVCVLAGAVSLVMQASPVRDAGEPTAAPRTVAELTSGSTTGDVSTLGEPTADPTPAPLVAPETGAGWTRVEAPAGEVTDEQLGQWTAQLYGIDDVAVGSYQPDSDPAAVFRYVGVNGHIPAASPEAAGRASLVSAAGTSVVSFSPEADGWLGCNGGSAQGTARVACAWVGEDRAVFLRWDDATLSMAEAASLTRTFRDHASA